MTHLQLAPACGLRLAEPLAIVLIASSSQDSPVCGTTRLSSLRLSSLCDQSPAEQGTSRRLIEQGTTNCKERLGRLGGDRLQLNPFSASTVPLRPNAKHVASAHAHAHAKQDTQETPPIAKQTRPGSDSRRVMYRTSALVDQGLLGTKRRLRGRAMNDARDEYTVDGRLL